MSQPAVIPVDDLIAPVSDASPTGEYLRWEDEYSRLEEYRRADEDAGSDDVWKREKKVSDWPAILDLGVELLATRSKDLQIAAWVAEAAANLRGAVGLRDGLRLILALQEAFWDKLHPDFGDLELREGVYEFIDHERGLALLIKGIDVTRSAALPPYSLLDYEQAPQTEKLAAQIAGDFEAPEALKKALNGRPTSADFEEAVSRTPRSFYVDLLATLDEAADAVGKINVGIRERWKSPNRPCLTKLEAAIETVRKFVQRTLSRKPDDSPPPSTPADAEAADETEPDADAESGAESEVDSAEPAAERAEPSRPRAPRRRAVGAPTTVEEAREQIADAAHALRGLNPDDPASHLVLRALAVASLYLPDGLDPANLAPPSSETRERLFLGSRSENWDEVLEEAERALGRPEGRGWLDLHRYSALALAGAGRDDARRAAMTFLKAFLDDREAWLDARFRDGTSCASADTRAWLEEEFPRAAGTRPAVDDLPRFEPTPADPSPSADADGAGSPHPPDPWEIAREHARRGEAVEALAIIARAVRGAGSGRERFIRELQQAEICLAIGRDALALPVLESLAARIDERKLDQWEEPGLCARVYSSLYRCLRSRDDARAAAIHHRLCQLDLGMAMQLETD